MVVSQKTYARGIRSNNPGNLIKTNIKWKGKVTHNINKDSRYEAFYTAHDGIRAMIMDVRNDIEKDGTNTVRKLITEYAPKFENPTQNYIDHIAASLKIGPDDTIIPSHYLELAKALILFENGVQPYSDHQLTEALKDSYNNY